jgi:tetratricopeptide (TPR) repeat protein
MRPFSPALEKAVAQSYGRCVECAQLPDRREGMKFPVRLALIVVFSSAINCNPGMAQGSKWRDYANAAMEAFNAGRLAESDTLLKAALAEAEKLGPQTAAFGEALQDLGGLYAVAHREFDAEPLLKRAVDVLKATKGPEDRSLGMAQGTLGAVQMNLRKYDEAEESFQAAVQIFGKPDGAENQELAQALGNLAQVYMATGRMDEAEEAVDRSLKMMERLKGSDSPALLMALSNLARLLEDQGEFDDSEVAYLRLIGILERAGGLENRDLVVPLTNLGGLYMRRRKTVQAEQTLARAVAITEKHYGADSLMLAAALNNLAGTYAQLERYAEAEAAYMRGLGIQEKLRGPEDVSLVTLLMQLGETYAAEGKYKEAEPFFQRGLKIQEARNPEHPSVGLLFVALGHVRLEQRNFTDAAVAYTCALDIFGKSYPDRHRYVMHALEGLGIAFEKLNKYEDAERVFKRALAVTVKPDDEYLDMLRSYVTLLRTQGRNGEAVTIEQKLRSAEEALQSIK